ncbi:MAG: acyl carrier protein [Peptoniphilaceae bacterium]|nr:acyl carrier protein [Peptoniphilaceae bacterium]MCI6660184.1 acyl carrier protein [Peptoniphilaceae bacterium]MDD7434209.1 acyl carrier protein [Peptoniphilaceae bacterium]MDD7543256.1 acyl carrier protein [Peptoniphilaceae bacterium]MDY3075305.1 acyl carrier protein [Peptoniphilaceae bacterium]
MNYLDQVIRIVAETMNADPAKLSRDTDIQADLHADSLDMVEMSMAVEDTFEIQIDDEAMVQIRTIGDIVDQLEKILQ